MVINYHSFETAMRRQGEGWMILRIIGNTGSVFRRICREKKRRERPMRNNDDYIPRCGLFIHCTHRVSGNDGWTQFIPPAFGLRLGVTRVRLVESRLSIAFFFGMTTVTIPFLSLLLETKEDGWIIANGSILCQKRCNLLQARTPDRKRL